MSSSLLFCIPDHLEKAHKPLKKQLQAVIFFKVYKLSAWFLMYSLYCFDFQILIQYLKMCLLLGDVNSRM